MTTTGYSAISAIPPTIAPNMDQMPEFVLRAFFTGVGATIVMDLWAFLLRLTIHAAAGAGSGDRFFAKTPAIFTRIGRNRHDISEHLFLSNRHFVVRYRTNSERFSANVGQIGQSVASCLLAMRPSSRTGHLNRWL